ncbi:MAG: VCBS repeat-containing protein [Planctomycetes bacterium]|nr:VCBS repeat-containing protein [Planctomycetota bacterium]
MQQLHRSKSTSTRRFAHCRFAALTTSLVFVCTSLAHAQRFGFPEELVPPTLTGGAQPFAVVDWDGDGNVDLLTAGAPGVLLNDGNGQFTATPTPTSIPPATGIPNVLGIAPIQPNFVAVRVNADVLVDMVGFAGGVTPLVGLNDGAGGFLPGTTAPVPMPVPPGTGVSALVAADFSGDGIDDLVLATTPAGLPVFLQGLPAGGFVNNTAIAFPAGNGVVLGSIQLAAFDADANGTMDLLSAEPLVGGSRRQLLLNLGGVFQPTALVGSLLPATPLAESFAVGDFSGNGLPDAVFFPVSAPGLVQAPAEFMIDIAFVGNVLPNLGLAFPTAATFPLRAIPTSAPATPGVLPGLVGAPTFYLSHPTLGTTWYGSDPSAVLTPLAPSLGVFASQGLVGDFDSDLDEDFAGIHTRANGPNVTRLVFNTTGGPTVIAATSDPAPGLGGGGVPVAYRLGDADGDLDLDVFAGSVVSPISGSVPLPIVATNDGDGLYTWPVPPAGTVLSGNLLFVGNLDGNPTADTIENVAGVATITLDAASPFAASFPLSVVGLPAAVSRVASSPNGTDFAVVSGLQVGFYASFGSNPVLTPSIAPAPVTINGLAVVDMDADGADDVVFSTNATTVNGLVFVARNVGTNTAPAFPALLQISGGTPQSGGNRLAIGDLDANGWLDVVAGSDVYLQTAANVFAAPTRIAATVPAWLFSPALADVEGDGDLDILGNLGTVGNLYLNNGAGTFGTASPLPAQLSTPPAVADVDFDGDPDYVSSNGMIVLNLLRQVALGLPARPGRPFTVQYFHELGGGTLFNAFWVPGLAPATAPLVGNLLVDPGTAILPSAIAPNMLGALAPAGAPVAINGDVDLQSLPAQPSLVGFTYFVQGGVSRPTFPGLIYLTGRRTITVRDL